MFRNWSDGRSRMTGYDLVTESLNGLLQRPGRSFLTMLGTVLGIGSFVAIIGISATAGGQIGKEFNVLNATQVTVIDQAAQNSSTATLNFPDDADQRIGRLNGVVAAGTWWEAPTRDNTVADRPGGIGSDRVETPVYAATTGLLAASAPAVLAGVVFNTFHERTAQNVAVIGAAIATQLNIGSLVNRPAIFIDGRPFTVIGIVATCARLPQLPLGVVVPATTARQYWGPPRQGNPAKMLIKTRLGAARLIAAQAPVALLPLEPQKFSATAPPDPTSLRRAVQGNLNSLFLLLAAVAVVVGALGIANTTLVAVLERSSEIGLRRSMGARRLHIAVQFLVEAAMLGLLGGVIGAALGVVTTLGVTILQDWTALLDPRYVLVAPAAGMAIGVLAGLYPALRASTIEPAEALRR